MSLPGLVAELTAVRLNDLAAPPEPLQLGLVKVFEAKSQRSMKEFFTRKIHSEFHELISAASLSHSSHLEFTRADRAAWA
jgi:hypothetical protein